MEISERGICVVTQPAQEETEKMHAHALANILAEITGVVVLTANLDESSSLREHDIVEYDKSGVGSSIFTAAVRFVLNQIRICQALLRRDEEFVLFFGTTSYVLPVIFARSIGKTVIVEPRGDVPLTLRLQWEERMPVPIARFLAGSVATLERVSYTTAHAIVTYTPSMADELGLRRYDDKLYTDGARYVDTERFRITKPYEERDNTVGYVGRLDEEKGIKELAEVARRVDARFVFVGDGNDRGWLEEELADEIESREVEITGWVDYDEVPEQMNRLRLLLLRSEPTEGLPTVILEAFACGTPVYANPVSGVPDVVRDGETGFVMDDKTPDEIARRVDGALEDGMDGMSRRCRELVEERYSFDAAVGRYRDIVNRI
ncbi:glycosyltransferase family 4 protein [Halorutilales archaeon Cl-col2-1]